jgi:hypothetical protein
MRDLTASIESEFRRYKAMADMAMGQVSDADLVVVVGVESNPIGVIVKHIGGNLTSRFTDFLKSDGEKTWRQRDGEFEIVGTSRAAVVDVWECGWRVLFETLASLSDADLTRTITIRSEPMPVYVALHRSLAHTASHVGQIVYVAKVLRGAGWATLSIPRGQSGEFNRAMTTDRRPGLRSSGPD